MSETELKNLAVETGTGSCRIGKKLKRRTPEDPYELYLCEDSTGKQMLLQIAADLEYNDKITRAAYILKTLANRSKEYEEDYRKLPGWKGDLLHYDWLFPEIVDSFPCETLGGRQINILNCKDAELKSLAALPMLLKNSAGTRMRMDVKTSIWPFGRMLKLLLFAHDIGIAAKNMASRNILIGPARHHMVVFAWDKAELFNSEVSVKLRQKDIADAARVCLRTLGCDVNGNHTYSTGDMPDEGKEGFEEYLEFLRRLASGKERRAEVAFDDLYAIVERLWGGRKYHKWTTYPY